MGKGTPISASMLRGIVEEVRVLSSVIHAKKPPVLHRMGPQQDRVSIQEGSHNAGHDSSTVDGVHCTVAPDTLQGAISGAGVASDTRTQYKRASASPHSPGTPEQDWNQRQKQKAAKALRSPAEASMDVESKGGRGSPLRVALSDRKQHTKATMRSSLAPFVTLEQLRAASSSAPGGRSRNGRPKSRRAQSNGEFVDKASSMHRQRSSISHKGQAYQVETGAGSTMYGPEVSSSEEDYLYEEIRRRRKDVRRCLDGSSSSSSSSTSWLNSFCSSSFPSSDEAGGNWSDEDGHGEGRRGCPALPAAYTQPRKDAEHVVPDPKDPAPRLDHILDSDNREPGKGDYDYGQHHRRPLRNRDPKAQGGGTAVRRIHWEEPTPVPTGGLRIEGAAPIQPDPAHMQSHSSSTEPWAIPEDGDWHPRAPLTSSAAAGGGGSEDAAAGLAAGKNSHDKTEPRTASISQSAAVLERGEIWGDANANDQIDHNPDLGVFRMHHELGQSRAARDVLERELRLIELGRQEERQALEADFAVKIKALSREAEAVTASAQAEATEARVESIAARAEAQRAQEDAAEAKAEAERLLAELMDHKDSSEKAGRLACFMKNVRISRGLQSNP